MAEKISVALASAGNRLREGVDDTLRTPPPKVQRGISAEAALIPRAQKLRRTKTMLSSWGDVRISLKPQTPAIRYLVMGVTRVGTVCVVSCHWVEERRVRGTGGVCRCGGDRGVEPIDIFQ